MSNAGLPRQISGHEPRALVDERFHRFIRTRVGVVQHRVVRQRFNRRHAYERCELQVIDTEFVSVALEIGPEQRVVLTIEGFKLLELPHARYLLREYTMQRG